MTQFDNVTSYPFTVEILFTYERSSTIFKCVDSGLVVKYDGQAFRKFKEGDKVTFKAKFKCIRNKPLKFKQYGLWKNDERYWEFDYQHDITSPKGIALIEK